jgi:glucosamine--fructose-6-phosphate aminotransferase (isomerizing)
MKSLGNFPDPFIAEIAGQPGALRRAAAGLEGQRSRLDALAGTARGRAPVFTGMGSSYDACYPAVTRLAGDGRPSLMLDAAELLHFRRAILGPSTLLVAVSQSGESAEVVLLVEAVREARDRPHVVAVTNGGTSTLAGLADLVLDTYAGEETGPSTMTFSGALVVLAAVAAIIGGAEPEDVVPGVAAEAARTAFAIERLLEDQLLPDRLAAWLGDRRTVVILGRGPARAAAEMGALTLKEAAGIAVESLQTAQFRHGPLELAGPDLAAIVIATEPETLELDVALAQELVGTGAAVLLVAEGALNAEVPGATLVDMAGIGGPLASAASILPLQLLAWRLAVVLGRTPGAYTRASKVTTVE